MINAPGTIASSASLSPYSEALGAWLKVGYGLGFVDGQFNISPTDFETFRKWALSAPADGLLPGPEVSQDERRRLTYLFWGVIAYLTLLGVLSAEVSITAALASGVPTAWQCAMAGLLGSCVAAFRSCLDRRANGLEDKFGNVAPDPKTSKERFSDGMVAWFIGRPLLGAVMGTMTLIAIRGHALGQSIGYAEFDGNPAKLVFYAWTAGLFTKTLLDLLLGVTKKVFKV